MKRLFSFLFLVVLSFFSSCSNTPNKNSKVGVDPTWYPLHFGNQENNVTAFSTELLGAIGEKEKIAFTRISVNWDDLLQGLQKEEYEAILSSMPPYLFNEKLFNFSSVYLYLGPVLVVRTSSTIDSIKDLEGKEIAVITGSSSDLVLEKSPGVLIRYYDSTPQALNAILTETIDGALVDALTATAYLRDLYQKELKIVTPPLTDEGLRLITKYDQSKELVKKFDKGLEELKENGDYNKLLDKWGLLEPKVH